MQLHAISFHTQIGTTHAILCCLLQCRKIAVAGKCNYMQSHFKLKSHVFFEMKPKVPSQTSPTARSQQKASVRRTNFYSFDFFVKKKNQKSEKAPTISAKGNEKNKRILPDTKKRQKVHLLIFSGWRVDGRMNGRVRWVGVTSPVGKIISPGAVTSLVWGFSISR